MDASSFGSMRRLWLALPLLALVIIVAASGADASDDATPSRAYMPFVRVEPLPPQFDFTPLVDLGSLTITDIANAGDERLFVATREGVVHIAVSYTHLDVYKRQM